MLVVDASVAVKSCLADQGFEELADRSLVAPPLMWSEARSVLHALGWRGDAAKEQVAAGHSRLHDAPVELRQPPELGPEAWRLADELGWARTYDAEYVALARLLGCRLVTIDARLRRAIDRLGLVVGPTEL